MVFRFSGNTGLQVTMTLLSSLNLVMAMRMPTGLLPGFTDNAIAAASGWKIAFKSSRKSHLAKKSQVASLTNTAPPAYVVNMNGLEVQVSAGTVLSFLPDDVNQESVLKHTVGHLTFETFKEALVNISIEPDKFLSSLKGYEQARTSDQNICSPGSLNREAYFYPVIFDYLRRHMVEPSEPIKTFRMTKNQSLELNTLIEAVFGSKSSNLPLDADGKADVLTYRRLGFEPSVTLCVDKEFIRLVKEFKQTGNEELLPTIAEMIKKSDPGLFEYEAKPLDFYRQYVKDLGVDKVEAGVMFTIQRNDILRRQFVQWFWRGEWFVA